MLDTMPKTATVEPNADLLARCEHALELLLTHRGNPSAEVDRVLADDPQCVFGHCLRAALIVLADDRRRAIHACRERDRHRGGVPRQRMTLRAVTRPRRVLGWRATRLLRPSVTAPSSSTGHATFSRSWSRMRSTSASAGGACCGIVSPRCCPHGTPRCPATRASLRCTPSASRRTASIDRAERIARRALALDPRLPAAIHVIVTCHGDAGAHP